MRQRRHVTLLATEQSAWVHSALKGNVKVKVRGRPWMSAVTAAIEESWSACVSFQTAAVSSHGAPAEGSELCEDSKWKVHSLPFWDKKKKHPDQMKETFYSSLSQVCAGSGFIVSGIFFSSFRLRSRHQFSRRCGNDSGASLQLASRAFEMKRRRLRCWAGRFLPATTASPNRWNSTGTQINNTHSNKDMTKRWFSLLPSFPFFPSVF